MLFDGIDSSNLELVKKAFAQGASADARSARGSRPLEFALRVYASSEFRSKDSPETKPNLTIENDRAIVQEIMKHINTVNTDDFVTAAGFGEKDIIEQMLAKGVDINTRNIFGQTALMVLLTRNPDLNVVKFLIEKGADINATDQRTEVGERDVLDYVIQSGTPQQLEIAIYLIDKGAKVKPSHFPLAATGKKPNFDLIKKIHKKIKDVDAKGPSGEVLKT